VHVPLADLAARLGDLPDGTVWVHCESGLRASIGASLIDRSGRDVVYIDDDYAHAAVAGFVTT
jgi:hydroxyacylglutathione hydrolase